MNDTTDTGAAIPPTEDLLRLADDGCPHAEVPEPLTLFLPDVRPMHVDALAYGDERFEPYSLEPFCHLGRHGTLVTTPSPEAYAAFLDEFGGPQHTPIVKGE